MDMAGVELLIFDCDGVLIDSEMLVCSLVSEELTRLGWTDPGGEEQTKYVKKVFLEMMQPGSEGEYGMAQFRKKNKNIDWAQFHAGMGA